MDEELQALTSTLLAYYNYGRWAYDELIRPRKLKINSLPKEDLALIPWYPKHIDNINECLHMNEDFTRNLALTLAPEWGVPADPSQWADCTTQDLDKVRSILLQLAREWSDEHAKERIGFTKIVLLLKTRFPDKVARQQCKILVPGCGTGRLVYELVREGYWTQGNEFSYHMLMASNFILNHSFVAHNYSIFPYIHKFSNVSKRELQIRPVTVPDINPAEISTMDSAEISYLELMLMVAGSFVDLYGPQKQEESEIYSNDPQAVEFRRENKGSFQVVATCYFLDTAQNIIDYIRTVSNCLVEDGIWVNFGPLLWHFEDDGNTSYVNRGGEQIPTARKGLELSKTDLLVLIEDMGFEFEEHEDIPASYCSDPRSLGGFQYDCVHFVARKKSLVGENATKRKNVEQNEASNVA